MKLELKVTLSDGRIICYGNLKDEATALREAGRLMLLSEPGSVASMELRGCYCTELSGGRCDFCTGVRQCVI